MSKVLETVVEIINMSKVYSKPGGGFIDSLLSWVHPGSMHINFNNMFWFGKCFLKKWVHVFPYKAMVTPDAPQISSWF
jgi:hypothetical protein